jgi:hypothetical protein
MGEIDFPQCAGGLTPRRSESQPARAGCSILLNARTAVGPIRALEPKKKAPLELPANARREAAFLGNVGNTT